jgi:hypothetical protein
MKKGKTSKLNVFENAKCFYGTVDSKELKSIYIVIQSWVEPKKDALNWDRVAGNLKRQIQHNLLECVDLITFDRNSIVDLDLRTSGIQLDKRSFMNLEITLFMKNQNEDFKSPILKEKIKKIVTSVYNDELYSSPYFWLSKTKTKKV